MILGKVSKPKPYIGEKYLPTNKSIRHCKSWLTNTISLLAFNSLPCLYIKFKPHPFPPAGRVRLPHEGVRSALAGGGRARRVGAGEGLRRGSRSQRPPHRHHRQDIQGEELPRHRGLGELARKGSGRRGREGHQGKLWKIAINFNFN